MSQAQTNNSTALPAPPEAWLSMGQVARALGLTERAVRQRCKLGKLTCRQCATPDGAAWFVDPACKPALWLAAGHADPIPAMVGDPLLAAPATKRRIAIDRWRAIEDYYTSLADRPPEYSEARWLQWWCKAYMLRRPSRRICPRTMRRWLATSGAKGIKGLMDARGGFRSVECDKRLWKMFEGLYHSEHQLSVRQCYDLVRAEADGRPWPSLRTVQRWANERLAPIKRACARQPKRFEDRFQPYVERDWTQVPAMACWVADNRKLDVFCRIQRRGSGGRHQWVKIRPWVQVWIDARSWYPPAWELYGAEPDASATAELFAAGVSLHGAPEEIYMDNGAGFSADAFAGGRPNRRLKDDEDPGAPGVNPIVDELGVKMVRFAQPYNHKAKVIEPWFKFVAVEFDKLFASYVGNAVSHRPGDVDKIAIDKLPTLQDVRKLFGEWITNTFSRQPSPAKAANGLSPMRAFVDLRDPDATYAKPSDERLSLLCMPSRPVRVTQNGVWVPEFGCHYWHPKLVERQGSGRDAKRKVSYRILPGRPERVFIFNEKDRYYCTAEKFVGTAMNPLIDSDKDGDDAKRLASVLELRGAIARHYKREVADDQAFARNVMLSAQRESLRATGTLDEDAEAPPAPSVIKLAPHLEAGARQMAEEDSGHAEDQRRRQRTAKERMIEFLSSGPDPDESAHRPTQAELIDRQIASQEEASDDV